MFNIFKRKLKEVKKVDVVRAIAIVNMREGMQRTITRTGYQLREWTFNGKSLLQSYLEKKHTLLCDDNGMYFPVVSVRYIEIKVEEYLVDETD